MESCKRKYFAVLKVKSYGVFDEFHVKPMPHERIRKKLFWDMKWNWVEGWIDLFRPKNQVISMAWAKWFLLVDTRFSTNLTALTTNLSSYQIECLDLGEGRAGFEFYFWEVFGQENNSNLIKYPFLEITKLQFGSKVAVKIPRGGKGEVFKCRTYARISLLCTNIDTCIMR